MVNPPYLANNVQNDHLFGSVHGESRSGFRQVAQKHLEALAADRLPESRKPNMIATHDHDEAARLVLVKW